MDKAYSCSECNASFVRSYNLRRHKKTLHGEDSEDEDETHSSQETGTESSVSDLEEPSSDKSEYNQSSDEEEERDSFQNLIDDALNQYHNTFQELTEHYQENGLSKRDATDEAFETLRPRYEKALKELFVSYIIDMFAKHRNPLFRSILRKIKDFEDDGLDRDEAIRSAVSYRKHSIYSLLNSKDSMLHQEDRDSDMET